MPKYAFGEQTVVKDMGMWDEDYWVLFASGTYLNYNFLERQDANGDTIAGSRLELYTDRANSITEVLTYGKMVEMPGGIIACLFENYDGYTYVLVDRYEHTILGDGVILEKSGSAQVHGVDGASLGNKQLVANVGMTGSVNNIRWVSIE